MDVEGTNVAAVQPKKTTGCDLLDRIEGLRSRRLESARRTHRELYEDLTEALEHAFEIKKDPPAQHLLKVIAKKPTLKFDTLEKCIKHVIEREFGESERQRTYVYRRALQVAAQQNVACSGLAKWLEDRGGVDKIATDNPVRPRTTTANTDQTFDAFAQKKDVLFEVDLPQDVKLKDGRHVAIIGVSGGKIRFSKVSTDYKMWAAAHRRFDALRQEQQELRPSAGTISTSPEVRKSAAKKAERDIKQLLKVRPKKKEEAAMPTNPPVGA